MSALQSFPLLSLPMELIILVLAELDGPTLLNTLCTCRQLEVLVREHHLWERLAQRVLSDHAVSWMQHKSWDSLAQCVLYYYRRPVPSCSWRGTGERDDDRRGLLTVLRWTRGSLIAGLLWYAIEFHGRLRKLSRDLLWITTVATLPAAHPFAELHFISAASERTASISLRRFLQLGAACWGEQYPWNSHCVGASMESFESLSIELAMRGQPVGIRLWASRVCFARGRHCDTVRMRTRFADGSSLMLFGERLDPEGLELAVRTFREEHLGPLPSNSSGSQRKGEEEEMEEMEEEEEEEEVEDSESDDEDSED
eukprot:CAMPEP_0177651894 /NCGR_PEP_ID=MMETSP0447-20121125/12806_1 /TAXON_ID=0 /ORGANISM="Stygamoeba regulata, Strain BSH-02190019" /LENGTH=311 /DNA_ID=CAMNT_0019155035 /DNA_START=99 /DNA_END=1034 /DNA_ORIENTATION=-